MKIVFADEINRASYALACESPYQCLVPSRKTYSSAGIYNRTLAETKAAMLLIPQSARVLAKNQAILVVVHSADLGLALAVCG
jgi:hypothetical protein